MICTINFDLIPEQFHPPKKETEELVENSPFAVEKAVDEDKLYKVFEKDNGWRSFRQSQLVFND